MTRYDRIISHTPIIIDEVNVGVANPTMFDCNLDIVGPIGRRSIVQGATRALGPDAE